MYQLKFRDIDVYRDYPSTYIFKVEQIQTFYFRNMDHGLEHSATYAPGYYQFDPNYGVLNWLDSLRNADLTNTFVASSSEATLHYFGDQYNGWELDKVLADVIRRVSELEIENELLKDELLEKGAV
jgi:hypothetical protein